MLVFSKDHVACRTYVCMIFMVLIYNQGQLSLEEL